MIIVREIDHGSPEYWEAVELRRIVLRYPLGMDYTDEQFQAEEPETHIAAFADGKIIGCLSLAEAGKAMKMRQVAVAPELQGTGVGRLLVAEAERVAIARGYSTMKLHARETAVPFYTRVGYAIEGERFEEVGLPHFLMTKALLPPLGA